MKQVEELLCNVTEELEKQFRTMGTTDNMPRVPMMILYAGEYAYQSQANISNTLRKVWRKREDAICHLKLEEEVDILDFQQKVDGLYDKENCFCNMNDLFLCFVFDTRDYDTIELFQASYERVEQIKEYSGEPYCLTMSIILVDESASGSNLSTAVKAYLREQLEQKKPVYRSTVILSNRLYNGARLKGEKIKENYDLAGNILLLANSEGADYSAPVTTIFPAENNAYYLTAAYSRKNRPNRKICEIVLNKVLSLMEEKLIAGDGLTLDELCKKLEITGGKPGIISEFFIREIKGNLPKSELLEYLPRRSKEMGDIRNKSYRVLNHETMGCAEVFYQKEFLPRIKDMSSSFSEQVQKYLSEQISFGEAARTLSDSMINNVLQQLRVSFPSEEMEAYQYLLERAEIDFVKMILPECKMQMQKLRERAISCMQRLRDLIQEFREGFFIDADEINLKDYYEELTAQFLARPDAEKTVDRFNNVSGDKEGILELLGEVTGAVISDYSIFAEPLVEEMTLRMGQNPAVIQQTLQNELMNDIGEKIRLRSHIALSMLQEIFIVNQKEDNGSNTMFFNYLYELKKKQDSVTFLDSGNNNSIEVVRLYQCDTGSLL